MTNKQPIFHVGDRVRVDFGPHKMTGVIVEDRGLIGIRRRRLFQVDLPMEPFEPMRVEVPEEEIEAIAPGSEPPWPKSRQSILDYLANGGLLSILRANVGGPNQPRAWLCPDQLGNVTHTFVPERGVVGGQTVPFFAMHESKIFKPKRAEVLAFLESFGLSRNESEQVIDEVGVAP